MSEFTNHLIHETSPYLLQHAHNPVNWYPWGSQALNQAVQEDKPILISIGYAACHWCHVMERESFEDAAVAAIMNEHFINIKIDREERPDLDHLYMNAVQTMTGSGGWPLNVFLTPERKPFYGGTYFPPVPLPNRPSWQQVLLGVANAFQNKRNDIESQAESLTGHLVQSNSFGLSNPPAHKNFSSEVFHTIFERIMATADTQNGGFGNAPKFPQTFTIQYLLRHFYYSGNEKALHQAQLSLNKMIYGGIYDHLGGGFARYATDNKWLVPHFEKMLYDNALLIIVLSEAFQLTQNNLYADTIQHTIDFTERELMNEEMGFFSAIDADSEGVEGKYYIWDKKEIESILGENAAIFCARYNISEKGNWEGRNILNVNCSPEEFAAQQHLNPETLASILSTCKLKLMEARRKRIPPLTDDKIILSWNALMNMACSKAYMATGKERYKTLAIKNMEFLLTRFTDAKSGDWFHTYKKGINKHPAFLDDYAFLVQALIYLQEITGNQDYLHISKRIMELIIDNFSEKETGFFFYTHRNQQDIIFRTREIYDGATPSGNAVMAWNLHYLSIVFELADWKSRALQICTSLDTLTEKYPTSFGMWASVRYDFFNGLNEIAVVGDRYIEESFNIITTYLPNKVIQSAAENNTAFPLLTKRHVKDNTYIYLCRNYNCLSPVQKSSELLQLIDKERRR